jgi:hypothetical protein
VHLLGERLREWCEDILESDRKFLAAPLLPCARAARSEAASVRLSAHSLAFLFSRGLRFGCLGWGCCSTESDV